MDVSVMSEVRPFLMQTLHQKSNASSLSVPFALGKKKEELDHRDQDDKDEMY
jgi:hypothetical protein